LSPAIMAPTCAAILVKSSDKVNVLLWLLV
jgi:hypothetical protein